jgi:adenylate cyclase
MADWKLVQNPRAMVSARQKIWEWRGVLLTTPVVTGLILAVRTWGGLQAMELGMLDLFVRLRPRQPPDARIVIVGVDETDLQQLRQWPTSDAVLAKALDKIRQAQPAAMGLDLYRDFPVEPGHRQLAQLFASTPHLIGIEKKLGDGAGGAIQPPPVLAARGQVGVNDVVIDGDGKLRRGLLYLTLPNQEPAISFGLSLALLYLQEKKGILPETAADGSLKLGEAVFRPFERHDGGYVNADAGGYQVLLEFRGAADNFETVALRDILQDRVPADRLRDRIVLLGATAPSLNDLFLTPFSSTPTASPVQMSGVEIHASLISQLITSAVEGRSPLQVWADPWEWIWTFGWTVVGASLSWRWRYAKHQRLARTMSLVLLAGLLGGGSYGAFLAGWWLPVVPGLFALGGSVFGITLVMARSAADIRKTFGRYLTDEVVNSLLATPEGLQLGGERRLVTILMSDLRGFSAACEQHPPEQVLAFLNRYLEIMTDVITEYQGTIDEFLGDAILVIFGAPTQRDDDAERAVACAVAMQLAMEKVNQHANGLNLAQVEMGIGIHTGEVVVGNIGSAKRAKYGVVGSPINLTSRIESYTVGSQILISAATRQRVGDRLQIKTTLQIQPKGFSQPIDLYDVKGIAIADRPMLCLPDLCDTLQPVDPPLTVWITLLDGKQLSHFTTEGTVVKLSTHSAELRSAQPLPPLTNLKLTLAIETDQPPIDEAAQPVPPSPSPEIYAKVMACIQQPISATAATYSIRFTFIAPELVAWLFNNSPSNKPPSNKPPSNNPKKQTHFDTIRSNQSI